MSRRLFLAAAAFLMAALLSSCVLLGSSAPPPRVAPLPEIEAVWEIEDTHAPSAEPLLLTLRRDGVPLPCDEVSGTFYCPLGLSRGEEWPQLDLTLPEGAGISACFADDYLFDACGDAVRDGTRYRLLVWTEDTYCYQDIVFTGLPILSVRTDAAEIGREDVPCGAVYSAAEGALASAARIHRRGASSLLSDNPKHGYRVEFTRTQDGRKKYRAPVPGYGEADTLVLLPLIYDETLIRDRLGWELWNRLAPAGEPFGARRLTYCEFFLNGDYRGIYLIIEPFQIGQELALSGSGSLLRDGVYRTTVLSLSAHDRAYYPHPRRANTGYTVYYGPAGADAFAPLLPYLDLVREPDDDAFARAFEAYVDADSALRHALLVQAGGMTDNFFNNMYIWAHVSNGKTILRFYPWDLDMSWGLKKEEIGQEYENWLYFPVLDRALNLDAGHLRGRLAETWSRLRSGLFSYESVQTIVEACAAKLNDSGAMARDAERWQTERYTADGQEILDFYAQRLTLLDSAVSRMAAGDAPLPFLSSSEFDGAKGGAILSYGPEEEGSP